jgi:hypothetical protein
MRQAVHPHPYGFDHDSAHGRDFRFSRSGFSRSSDFRLSRALENQWQEANFVFVDGEISLPHHPNGIVPEKRPSTPESSPADGLL